MMVNAYLITKEHRNFVHRCANYLLPELGPNFPFSNNSFFLIIRSLRFQIDDKPGLYFSNFACLT